MAFDFFIETKNRGMIPPRKHCYLVEGTDDAVFMDQLLKISNHDPTLVCVMETNGRDNLARFLQVFSKIPEFTSGNIASIVVMFDADDAPGKAEQLVHNAYDQVGMEKPKPGEFLNKTIPGTGLYLFPGNGRTGNLENIFIEMLRDKDDIRCEAAEEVIKRIIDSGVDLDKLSKRKNANGSSRIHARSGGRIWSRTSERGLGIGH